MSSYTNKPRPISTLQPLLQSTYSQKKRHTITFPADSLYTKQEFKQECDINTLMARYMASGELPNLNPRSPQYLELTGEDFQTSMNIITQAQSLFNELPSTLRNRFQNDPGQFLDFVSDPANINEMAALGLLRDIPDVTVPLSAVSPPGQNTEQNEPQNS